MFSAMAVADVVLEMGPRNRRRVTKAGIGLAMVLAVVAVVLVTRPSNHSGPAVSAPQLHVPPAIARLNANRSKVVFGLTKQQVRHLIGPPTRIVGNCWHYPLYEFTFQPGDKPVRTGDGFCFVFGVYNTHEFWQNGKWWTLSNGGVQIAAP